MLAVRKTMEKCHMDKRTEIQFHRAFEIKSLVGVNLQVMQVLHVMQVS